MSQETRLHTKLADAIGNPNRVWCRTCGHSLPVNSAVCLATGWPKHCGYTMTIDQPAPTPESQNRASRAPLEQP